MKKGLAFLMVFLTAGVIFLSSTCHAEVSRTEMIGNASAALEEGGATLEGADIIYDDGNTLWDERVLYMETDTTMNHGILPHGILKDKDYQVIYFDLTESSPTGDAWVFMDPETGDVIAIYEEKE